jgi:hypothetical protein
MAAEFSAALIAELDRELADLADSSAAWATRLLGKAANREHPAELVEMVKRAARTDPDLNPQVVAGVASAIYEMTKGADDNPTLITDPTRTPASADGGNILHRGGRVAALLDAGAAAREAHRHKATGQFRSPSRSAGTVLGKEDGLVTAGPWKYTIGQKGAA